MPDFLDKLAQDAKQTVESGYYEDTPQVQTVDISLKTAILKSAQAPVITEIKSASPSRGPIRTNLDVGEIAKAMARGGAVGISVLTEPKNFQGAVRSLVETRQVVHLPLLMKDIVISTKQLEAAAKTGANMVLLIQALFDRGYYKNSVEMAITEAHSMGLEVLLEIHNMKEFRYAICTNADLIGINNRDLGTLKVDLNTTKSILEQGVPNGKVVVSESGINSAADIRFLYECGANGFLVGSAVMLAKDVEAKVRELVSAPLTVKAKNKIITNVKSREK